MGCAAWRAAPDGWELVHADYYEKKEYVVSAVLHLGPADETTLIGGETGLVDELNERGLVRGLVVAPRVLAVVPAADEPRCCLAVRPGKADPDRCPSAGSFTTTARTFCFGCQRHCVTVVSVRG